MLSSALLRQRNDSANPRRNQNPFPQAILAGAERPANLRVNLGNVDPRSVERPQSCGIALLEQSNQQVLGTDVVMAVVTALLLRYPKHATRRWVKVGKQASFDSAQDDSDSAANDGDSAADGKGMRRDFGATRFERATSSSRTKRSTKLSHAPMSLDRFCGAVPPSSPLR